MKAGFFVVLGAVVCGAVLVRSGRSQPSTSAEIRSCDAYPWITAPDELYAAGPVYGRNMSPNEEVHAFAENRAGFEQLWIEKDRNGWVHVGVTGDVGEWQAALDQEFPGEGVVAVPLPYTVEQLDVVKERAYALIERAMDDGSWGTFDHPQTDMMPPVLLSMGSSVPSGVVEIRMDVLTAERRRVFDEMSGEPICIDGGDATAE